MKDLREYIKGYNLFISVDNFFPHFCNHYGLTGIVIFSKSDPKIFGYHNNMNILGDEKFLRMDQFGLWESCDYVEEAFPPPEQVMAAVNIFKR